MNRNYLRNIILFGTLVMACLVVIQVYWFNRAFNVAEKQFDHSVQVALKKVADSVSNDSQIKKLSNNFFYVATETSLNNQTLDTLLKQEFSLRSLDVDYELGVYNAEDDTLLYGHYVEGSGKKFIESQIEGKHDAKTNKNFAVYFPAKKSYIARQMDIWIFSTFILLLMLGFFTYAIASLLRERKFAELKNDFINNMTHEFKTPVTNINIAAEVLRRKFDQEGAQVYIDILLKENEKLRHKIDEVLLGSSVNFSKPASLYPTNIHALLEECAQTFQLKLKERNGNITLQFNARSAVVLGDRDLLTQAFINVIDNAEKYSRHNPAIMVRTCDTKHGIEIHIIDNGIGIPSGFNMKVFEKFFRVPYGDVHNVKGFGLGLNFVKNVITSHKGKVDLVSEVNKGTEVRIFLPEA